MQPKNKSYWDSTDIELTSGFNLVIGPNNAGKSALLEALSLRFPAGDKPHRSIANLISPESPISPKSVAEISFQISREELALLSQTKIRDLSIPLPTNDNGLPFDRSAGIHDVEYQQKLFEWVLSHDHLNFTFSFTGAKEMTMAGNVSFGLYEAPPGNGVTRYSFTRSTDSNGIMKFSGPYNEGNPRGDFGFHLIPLFIERIYITRAERVIGICPAGLSSELASNGSNLPEVIENLSRNLGKAQRFNSLIKQVLPQIHGVSVRDIGEGQREVVVWPVDVETERIDLAVPLSECGTGIGQIVTILYVVFNSSFDRTIIIDEPQSFLHPGSLRRLMEVLRLNYSNNQYIIATHSPTIITATDHANLLLVRQSAQGLSSVERLDTKVNSTLKSYLLEIGARPSDVFGADSILWVEGPTEEECFPKIWDAIVKQPLLGTAILGVKSTSDLTGKNAERIFDIYEKLSQRPTVLPPALGFIFDRELRSATEITDLKRKGKGRVWFIPRRLYENYLLLPEAITHVLNDSLPSEEAISAVEVSNWIEAKGNSPDYGAKTHPIFEESWRREVDGARLLKDLFSDLSEARVEFDKTNHSVKMTEWILLKCPNELDELANLLRQFAPTNA